MSRFLRALRRDFGLKVFALVVALILWAYASLERVYALRIEAGLDFTGLRPSLVVARTAVPSLHLLVEAKGKDFLRLYFRRPDVRFDLQETRPGVNRLPAVRAEFRGLPPGSLRAVEPETLEVFVDQFAQRAVEVDVPIQGRPARGLALTAARPREPVVVGGPRDAVSFLARLTTEPLNLAGLASGDERRLKVLVPEGRGFTVRPESVTVRVEFEAEARRQLAIRVLTDRAANASVRPNTVLVEIYGPASRVTTLRPEQVRALIRTRTLPAGTHRLPAEISLPEGVYLATSEPTHFDVDVTP